MTKLRSLAAITLLNLAISTSASATTYTYNFGETGSSSASFASLSFNDVSDMFSLTLNQAFGDAFGANAFVGSVAVDYLGRYKGATPGVDTGSVSGGGVNTVGTSSGGAAGGAFDFRYVLGGGSHDRLTSNETVSWKSSAFDISKLGADAFSLHIQGGNTSQFLNSTSSSWSISGLVVPPVSAVPEPKAYALFIGGICLMGFMARQRKNQQV